MRFFDHLYIVATIVLTLYSQLVMRWQVELAGALPSDVQGRLLFVAQLFLNPWVASSIVATLFSGISWMLTMTRFEISYAYPWIGLNFVLMFAFGVMLFGDSMSMAKFVGTLLVAIGIAVIALGQR